MKYAVQPRKTSFTENGKREHHFEDDIDTKKESWFTSHVWTCSPWSRGLRGGLAARIQLDSRADLESIYVSEQKRSRSGCRYCLQERGHGDKLTEL